MNKTSHSIAVGIGLVVGTLAGASIWSRTETKKIMSADEPIKALPLGCEIWIKSASGKEWHAKSAITVELRTVDGPTQVGFMEDGAVEMRCFGLQSVRFGAANGVDNVFRLELK